MRVLHVHSGNLYGGVETVLATLARFRHHAPSMEMSVALCFDGQIAAEIRAAGIEPQMLGDVRLRRPDTVLRARRVLRRILERGQFEAVVCHQAWTCAVFGSAVKASQAPLVLWLHMAQQRHWLDRLAWRVGPDLVICNSRFTASGVPHTGVRVEVVYAPVESRGIARDPEVRRSLGATESDVVIVQASRMEPLKGQRICLEALARLRELPGWTCWQVGGAQRPEEHEYLAQLRRQARALGIADRVNFLGHRSDVPALLAAADIFCQPNLQPDAFGVGFVEALAAGCPVVTSAIGGALEVVDESCGVLVPPNDTGTLASELSHLITDPADRARLGRTGPARARALCDPGTQVRRLAAVLGVAAGVAVHA
jgi:glycosyltransferase involved in cell wall biosynthesis